MATRSLSIRLEQNTLDLLNEGANRTQYTKQELIRLTLRRHLRKMIDQEARKITLSRITNIEPWRKGVLAAAYKRIAHENWDAIEAAAVRSQRKPSIDD